MRRMSRTPWIVGLGLIMLSSGLLAQAKPNFSGRWVQVSPERGAGREDIVTHDATTLTIEGASRKEAQVTFKLDGTESRTVRSLQGTEMVVNTSSTMPGMPPRDEKVIYTKK